MYTNRSKDEKEEGKVWVQYWLPVSLQTGVVRQLDKSTKAIVQYSTACHHGNRSTADKEGYHNEKGSVAALSSGRVGGPRDSRGTDISNKGKFSSRTLRFHFGILVGVSVLSCSLCVYINSNHFSFSLTPLYVY